MTTDPMTTDPVTTDPVTTDAVTAVGLRASTRPTPIGELTVVVSDTGVRAVLWPDDDPARVPGADGAGAAADALLDEAWRQLDEYFAGERTVFDLPLDPLGTPFQQQAWTALQTIEFGTTVTYAEQAERMGDRRKARAVGAANGRNPISIIVPCHRVVGADGSLTGFAGGVDTKQWLLDHERRVTTVAPGV
jgi:methylated-DNA-[protein]-cysteine S-methyltransferase